MSNLKLNVSPCLLTALQKGTLSAKQHNTLLENVVDGVIADPIKQGRPPKSANDVLQALQDRSLDLTPMMKKRKKRPALQVGALFCTVGFRLAHADEWVTAGKVELIHDPEITNLADDAEQQFHRHLFFLEGDELERETIHQTVQFLVRHLLAGETSQAETAAFLLYKLMGFAPGIIFMAELDQDNRPIRNEEWALVPARGKTVEQCKKVIDEMIERMKAESDELR